MYRYLFAIFIFAGLLSGSSAAQAPDQSGDNKARPVKPPRDLETASPFALEGRLPLAVVIRSADAMAQQDKDVVAGAEASIRERARLENLNLEEGGWKYSQIDCPAFPGHLLLRYMRENGPGDVSLFTASIPRRGQGKVRVIPILRRGYSLFSPAPVNAITIGAFNQIREEEHADAKAEWAALGLCYAALAGANGTGPDASGVATLRPAGTPFLQLSSDGEATIAYRLGNPHPADWELRFDRRGRLVQARHSRATELQSKAVPRGAEEKGKTIKSSPVEAPRPIPATPEQSGRPIPPSAADPTTKPQ